MTIGRRYPAAARRPWRKAVAGSSRRFAAPVLLLLSVGCASVQLVPVHADASGESVTLGPAVEVRADGTERICGHLCMEPSGHGSEELAVVVADDRRHTGLGRRLVLAGLEWAHEHGVAQVTATAFTFSPSGR